MSNVEKDVDTISHDSMKEFKVSRKSCLWENGDEKEEKRKIGGGYGGVTIWRLVRRSVCSKIKRKKKGLVAAKRSAYKYDQLALR